MSLFLPPHSNPSSLFLVFISFVHLFILNLFLFLLFLLFPFYFPLAFILIFLLPPHSCIFLLCLLLLFLIIFFLLFFSCFAFIFSIYSFHFFVPSCTYFFFSCSSFFDSLPYSSSFFSSFFSSSPSLSPSYLPVSTLVHIYWQQCKIKIKLFQLRWIHNIPFTSYIFNKHFSPFSPTSPFLAIVLDCTSILLHPSWTVHLFNRFNWGLCKWAEQLPWNQQILLGIM